MKSAILISSLLLLLSCQQEEVVAPRLATASVTEQNHYGDTGLVFHFTATNDLTADDAVTHIYDAVPQKYTVVLPAQGDVINNETGLVAYPRYSLSGANPVCSLPAGTYFVVTFFYGRYVTGYITLSLHETDIVDDMIQFNVSTAQKYDLITPVIE